MGVRVGLRAGRVAQGADVFRHDAGDQGAAHVGAHGLGAGNEVVPRGPLHGVVALVDEAHHRVLVIRLDLRTILFVGKPGVIRDLADAGELRPQGVGQGLDGLGVRVRVCCFGAPGGGHGPVLMRHHAADLLEHGGGKGVLEGKTLPLRLGLLVQVAVYGPLEEGGSLWHSRHLVVHDQGGGALLAPHLLHGIVAEMGRTAGAPPALQTRHGAPQAQPPS